jgi:hypothetical protein
MQRFRKRILVELLNKSIISGCLTNMLHQKFWRNRVSRTKQTYFLLDSLRIMFLHNSSIRAMAQMVSNLSRIPLSFLNWFAHALFWILNLDHQLEKLRITSQSLMYVFGIVCRWERKSMKQLLLIIKTRYFSASGTNRNGKWIDEHSYSQ